MTRAVRHNQHGLVIPPSERDCFGPECPVAEKRGACFVDRHHLYFPAELYGMTELAYEFATNPENIVWMARCSHEGHHNDNDYAEFPDEEVMEMFIKESTLKQDYIAILKLIDVKLGTLTTTPDISNAGRSRRAEVAMGTYNPRPSKKKEDQLLADLTTLIEKKETLEPHLHSLELVDNTIAVAGLSEVLALTGDELLAKMGSLNSSSVYQIIT